MQYPAMVINAAKAIIKMQISAMARIKRNCVPVKNRMAAGCTVLAHPGLPCVHNRMALFVKNPDMRPQFHFTDYGQLKTSSIKF
jgi:hypothetical protein